MFDNSAQLYQLGLLGKSDPKSRRDDQRLTTVRRSNPSEHAEPWIQEDGFDPRKIGHCCGQECPRAGAKLPDLGLGKTFPDGFFDAGFFFRTKPAPVDSPLHGIQ